MDQVLEDYFAAWNETDHERRGQLLERSLGEDVELLDPLGHWHGRARVAERIAGYHASAPGTRVLPASGVESHNNVERYLWKIVDASGEQVMEGLDVAERDGQGRLRRIVMFHGAVPS